MKYYINAFKNYAETDGRANRREFLLFSLVNYIIIFSFAMIDAFFGLYPATIPIDYGYLTLIYLVISAIPTICVRVRRLHDVDKNGRWWFLGNVPLIGFYVLYLYLKRGTPGINQYGAPPNAKSEQSGPEVPPQKKLPEELQICSVAEECEPERTPQKQSLSWANQEYRTYGTYNVYGSDLTIEKDVPVPLAAEAAAPRTTEKAQPALEIRFCRKCGFELVQGSNFCSRCGTPIKKEN